MSAVVITTMGGSTVGFVNDWGKPRLVAFDLLFGRWHPWDWRADR